jgi:spore coat protein U-like protein
MTNPLRLQRSLAAALTMTLLGAGASVQAGTDTDTLIVTATVAAVCQIDTVDQLDFGTISPSAGANYDAQANITWRCTTGTVADIDLDGGSSGDINARAMDGTTETLPYQLYTDATRLQVWGDGGTGDDVDVIGAGMGVPNAVTTTVYGRVLDTDVAGLAPDTFNDAVTVTINF